MNQTLYWFSAQQTENMRRCNEAGVGLLKRWQEVDKIGDKSGDKGRGAAQAKPKYLQ